MVKEFDKQLLKAYLNDVMNSKNSDVYSVSTNGNIEQCIQDSEVVVEPTINNTQDEVINPINNDENQYCENPIKLGECGQMKEAVGLLLASSETSFEEKREALLVMAVCSEYMAKYNYWYSYMSSMSNGKADFDPEFKQHEDDEGDHAQQFVDRLRELGCYNPVPLFEELACCGSHEFIQESGNSSIQFLQNRICEEKQAVEFYSVCVNFFRESDDSTTHQLFKQVKAKEEEHLKDLNDLMMQYQ